MYANRVTTGWDSLDAIIDDLRRGDNVVWQVDCIDDYQRVVLPFVNSALSRNERVIYLRFGRHMPLLEERAGLTIHTLKSENSFESFSSAVHRIITEEGRDTLYVFDSLSDLLHIWATDLMIGDFFRITCPYLFQLNTIAYFAIFRNNHSFKSIARIRETTQVLIDIHSAKGTMCIHPIKALHRYSTTMFFPHVKEKDQLIPVINSVDATRLFSHLSRHDATGAQRHLDYWDRLFMEARNLMESRAPEEEQKDMVQQLSRLMLTRDKRLLAMIRRHFTLGDLLAIKDRLIGTGFIGGKSLGMLLARKILEKDRARDWPGILEHHDSFYIGSDVFYSYMVRNGWWQTFMEHKTQQGYFPKALELKEKMENGVFPEEIVERFKLMLEYFGQSPIIVRSSSLLEDAFGSAFAGKYDSYFCVNQDDPKKRYEFFEKAVLRIFACTMGEDALSYRRQRGLDQTDEQMALLVMRVSGAYRESNFYPDLAGVALSRNPFMWKQTMNPKEGMVRLVHGLGTRAVNRVANDYPRIVALDAPLAKPLLGVKDIRKYSQHHVDLLNLEQNRLETVPLSSLLERHVPSCMDRLSIRDHEAIEAMRDMGRPAGDYRILTFDPFLTETPFVDIMKSMLTSLEQAYDNPVEIEFTLNFDTSNDAFHINLLQCRPLKTMGPAEGGPSVTPTNIARVILSIEGNAMGGTLAKDIARIILVNPDTYLDLSVQDKYAVARLVGKLNRAIDDAEKTPTLLMGPGRWGTHTPAMGIPVTFSEINRVAAIAEISHHTGSLVPDLSFGTHFFHDLVETGIVYLAVYPESSGVICDLDWIRSLPNLLTTLAPESGSLEHVIHAADTRREGLKIHSDVENQTVICYLAEKNNGDQNGKSPA
ncbi:PEP/pyruvate-binding domain-containing protein [Desulfatiferula olefinivorans]